MKLSQEEVKEHLKTIHDLKIDLKKLGVDAKKAGVREGQLMAYISRNNLPVIPMHGAFHYDISKDIGICNRNQIQIYGFDKSENNFNDILSKVDSKSKSLFQEQTLGNICKVDEFQTNQFQLTNGNIIFEEYKFGYHKEDYERKSLVSISGQTTLLRKVA